VNINLFRVLQKRHVLPYSAIPVNYKMFLANKQQCQQYAN